MGRRGSGGGPPITSPSDAETVKELNPDLVLALEGPSIPAEDVLVLNAFADQLAAVLEHGRLRVEAGRAQALAAGNELRGALLQAVSHDLRTPLASIKACATSLANRDVALVGGGNRRVRQHDRLPRPTGSLAWWATCST